MNCPERTVHETIDPVTVIIDDNGADGFNDKDSDSEYEDASSSLDTELEDGEINDECYQQEPSSDMQREAPSTILRYVTMDPPKQPNALLYRNASLQERPQRLTDLRPRPPPTLRYTTTHSRPTAHYTKSNYLRITNGIVKHNLSTRYQQDLIIDHEQQGHKEIE